MDVGKILVDHEKEEEIKEDERFDKERYMLINSSFGMVGATVEGAEKFKKCCCNAYSMAAVE